MGVFESVFPEPPRIAVIHLRKALFPVGETADLLTIARTVNGQIRVHPAR